MLDFQAARWLIGNEVPGQAGNNHPTAIPTGVFKTADGFINIASTGGNMWERLCAAIGAPELATRAEYADSAARSKHRDALNAEIEKKLAHASSGDWIAKLNEAANIAMKRPEIARQLEMDGMQADTGAPELLDAQFVKDAELWGPVIKAHNIVLE